ncbi:MAG: UDP-N-acetylmuramoyl-tripeptide--D-alanyl-D-alanine ligase [Clostridia bacterium]|nr:UDP-N-acetylmuramoyl-tripeptide--D-alanyl-D-alanine ligase [Clostridia bacterium]
MKTIFSVEPISAVTFARLCGGELRDGIHGAQAIRGICTDSREADGDVVFAAIRGEHQDGHDFIASAIEKGCRCILCEHSCEAIVKSGVTAVVVTDVSLALCRMANTYRTYLSSRMVAVTGSVGKTTTKDLIYSVLSVKEQVFRTPGNHNSLIGMPMSMVEIPSDSQWAVLEMGMSNFGEIERLSITAEPEIAVITNIGTAHLEFLGSRENIRRAKLEILSGLKSGGTLILSGDEPLLANVRGKSYQTLYASIEREDADFCAKNITVDLKELGMHFDVLHDGKLTKGLFIHLLGRHNVYAGLYAFAVGMLAGLDEEEIRYGLSKYRTEGMRQNVYDYKGITIIEDCYNASPESMIAALDVLEICSEGRVGRSIAVLGDMLELGDDSPALHRLVGESLVGMQIDKLYTVGHGGYQIGVGARQKGMAPENISDNRDRENLKATAKALLKDLKPGDVVLFKASRAVGAERIIEELKKQL